MASGMEYDARASQSFCCGFHESFCPGVAFLSYDFVHKATSHAQPQTHDDEAPRTLSVRPSPSLSFFFQSTIASHFLFGLIFQQSFMLHTCLLPPAHATF